MPAIYDSLKKEQGLSSHVAWRVAFIVPFIMITAVALSLLLLTDDTPTGKWSERGATLEHSDRTSSSVVPTAGALDSMPATTGTSISSADEKKQPQPTTDVETGRGDVQALSLIHI